MFGALALSPLLPPKKKKTESRGRLPLVAYRSQWDQYDYIDALLQRGYSLSEVMSEMVRLHMHLDARLSAAGIGLSDFAVAEGLAARDGVADDISWLPEAVARLVIKGADAYRRERPEVSFAHPGATQTHESSEPARDLLEEASRVESLADLEGLFTTFTPAIVETMARSHNTTPQDIWKRLNVLRADIMARKNPPRPKPKK